MSARNIRINLLLLSGVQYFGYLIPFIITPYLARVFGLESYGHFVFIQSLMIFGALVVDYGFSWSMTKRISENRDDKNYISDIFINGLVVQLVLLFIVAISLYLYIIYSENNISKIEYLSGLVILIGQVLYTPWVYQGLEIFKFSALFQLLGKVAVVPLLLIYIDDINDVSLALLSMGLPSIIFGLYSIYFLFNRGYIKFRSIDFSTIGRILYDGFVVFSSRMIIGLYTNLIPIAIGSYAGASALGLFSVADRIRLLVQSFMQPVSQVLFPRMSWLLMNDISGARSLFRASLIWSLASSILLSSLAYIFGKELIFILAGPNFVDSVEILNILLFIPPFVCISGIFGLQYMLPRGKNKHFFFIVGLGALVFLVGVRYVVETNGVLGASFLILFVEVLISMLMIFFTCRSFKFLK